MTTYRAGGGIRVYPWFTHLDALFVYIQCCSKKVCEERSVAERIAVSIDVKHSGWNKTKHYF